MLDRYVYKNNKKMRMGYTTGSCAAAAAKAAAWMLLGGTEVPEVKLMTPKGIALCLEVLDARITADGASCAIRKDAGDDPDVTDGLKIYAEVKKTEKAGIEIDGGEGVGRVTRAGLEQPVGAAAINKIPRQMIREGVEEACRQFGYEGGLSVLVRIPGGRELAAKTFNPRLGIVGGISILGTSGIVKPFSSEAFVNSIRKEMGVAVASGTPAVVINSGAKSERFLRAYFPGLPAQAFVQYGNFIGETIRVAAEAGATDLRLGIMLGKAVKLAEGHLDTHSHKVVFNRDYLTRLATEAGCSPAAISLIGRMTLARELWEGLSADDSDRFFPRLLDDCLAVCAPLFPGKLTILLIDDAGRVRYQVLSR